LLRTAGGWIDRSTDLDSRLYLAVKEAFAPAAMLTIPDKEFVTVDGRPNR
jgi:hypothetical protein